MPWQNTIYRNIHLTSRSSYFKSGICTLSFWHIPQYEHRLIKGYLIHNTTYNSVYSLNQAYSLEPNDIWSWSEGMLQGLIWDQNCQNKAKVVLMMFVTYTFSKPILIYAYRWYLIIWNVGTSQWVSNSTTITSKDT